jgi:hypothetical protein
MQEIAPELGIDPDTPLVDTAGRVVGTAEEGKAAHRAKARLSERDQEIVRLVRDEWLTDVDVAGMFFLSRERVRQILRAAGVGPETSRRNLHEHAKVEWRCSVCGVPEKVLPGELGRSTCGEQSCIQGAMRGGPDGEPARHWNRAQQRWTVRDPETGKSMRLERYLMQQHLGRPLRSDEWVVLKDGDPHNVSLDNIEILSPSEGTARRNRHAKGAWSRRRVIEAYRSIYRAQSRLMPPDEHAPSRMHDYEVVLPGLDEVLRLLDVARWEDAEAILRRELGLDRSTRGRGRRPLGRGEVIAGLLRFRREHGRMPRTSDFRPRLRPPYLASVETIKRAVGLSAWGDVLRLAETVEEVLSLPEVRAEVLERAGPEPVRTAEWSRPAD